jgi:hypothetical protein
MPRSPNVVDIEMEERRATKKRKQHLRNHRITQIIVDFSIIITVDFIYLIIVLTVDPRINYFYCDDHDIFYPNMVETVPFWAVPIYGILGPLLIITLVEFVNTLTYVIHIVTSHI